MSTTDDDFVAIWDAAGSLAAVVTGVSDGSPPLVPRRTEAG